MGPDPGSFRRAVEARASKELAPPHPPQTLKGRIDYLESSVGSIHGQLSELRHLIDQLTIHTGITPVPWEGE